MGHILVADDHVFLLKALSILLSKEGYTFELAENGQQAIDLFESGKFDAVVTDLDMPIKNGFEVIKHIRAGIKCQTPIIVLSSLFTAEDNLNFISESGASKYVSKMESPMGILSALKDVLPQAS